MEKLGHALKEWQVAVNALERGETILLLRKGGIREVGGKFAVQHEQVLLYPTYEHQKSELLKPAYADQVQPVESGWHSESVRIGAWAQITHQFEVTQPEAVAGLVPFHIWNEAFVTERLKWKPNVPLSGLLLRVYRLAKPEVIPFLPVYGGCRSWIDLAEPMDLARSEAVLTDAAYHQQVDAIQSVIAMELQPANP